MVHTAGWFYIIKKVLTTALSAVSIRLFYEAAVLLVIPDLYAIIRVNEIRDRVTRFANLRHEVAYRVSQG
jgi:hypothetical protein